MTSPPPTPARRALFARLSEHSTEITEAAIERMRGALPAYANLDISQLLPDAVRTVDQLLDALAAGRALTDAELELFTAHGETRGRQGIPVTVMFGGWRMAVRYVVDEIVTMGRAAGMGERELLDVSNEMVALTDTAILAMARGHLDADFELTRHDQQRRADLVRGILFGTLGPGAIRLQLERYGLNPDLEYRAIRVRPTADMPADRLIRLLEPTPDQTRRRSLIAVVDGDIAGIVDTAPTGDIGVAAGIGPLARIDRMESSFRRATRAMTTADAFGRTGIHTLGDLGLLPAMLADTEVSEEIVRRYITPLGETDSATALLDTARHYLSNGMRVDRTAEAMRLHTNTVRYRLRRYQELLDIDLADPARALEAWWSLEYLFLLRRAQ